jgi:hypothetical protein
MTRIRKTENIKKNGKVKGGKKETIRGRVL